MPWQVTLPDGSKGRTDHLEVGAAIDIAKGLDVTWAHVVDFTVAGDGTVMLAVYEWFLNDSGQAKPDGLTMKQLSELFEQVEDDLPTEFDEGNPPEADSPETT